jgi:clathrin heavy chain
LPILKNNFFLLDGNIAGQQLQIFNLEQRAKLKSHAMPAPVGYWRWITPTAIALVTATSVFHWSIDGDSAPVKIFDRNPGLTEGSQIINYQVSNDGKWCLLCGISAGGAPGVINGTMQLYSTEKSVSQMLQGHSGVFSVIKVPGRDEPAQVLCFEDKKPDQPAKLFIMEVGRDKNAPGGVFRVTPQAIPVAPDAPNDFPVTMNVSRKHDVIYMISKMGFLYLFDVFSGKAIYRARITTDTVFVATEHTATGGILGITRRGQVLHVGLNDGNLVPYIVGQGTCHPGGFTPEPPWRR